MKAQQSTKFEASWSLWTRPLWYFGSVSRKTSWDSEMSKSKTVRKKRCQKQYTLIPPWRWLCLWYNTKIILHTRDPWSPFSWNGSNWYLALECAHTELCQSWFCVSWADFDHEILLVAQKNSSIKLSWGFCIAEKRRDVFILIILSPQR